MDVATDLVEVFLRSNGYLTLSELQIQSLNKRGDWETVTDVDILALRFPGRVFIADAHNPTLASELEVPGVPLYLEEDTIDVIVGEVKQGEASFNPSLTKHETLHTALHRLSWIYSDGDLDRVVEDLRDTGVCHTPARGGGTVRTRIVAFGQASEVTMNVIPLQVIIERALDALQSHDALLRSARSSSPAAAMLKLLHKTGFRFSRDP
ncbi:MAG: hypothetical protein V3U46_00280 [Acidimicrobiia bacterium]